MTTARVLALWFVMTLILEVAQAPIFAQLSTFVNMPVIRVMIREELSETFLIVFLTIAFVYT